MIRIRRRLLIDTALLGAGITMLVVLADQMGLFVSLENWAYDRRARDCQFFAKPPTTQLVHLDIDDRALDKDAVGEWPWPRSRFGEILDELHIAGPKVVGLDITFPGPQDIKHPPKGSTAPDIDNDADFAAALKHLACAIVPVDLSLESLAQMPPLARAIRDELTLDPALERDEVTRRLAAKGMKSDAVTDDLFLPARRQAVFERILDLSRGGQPPLAEVRAKLLPAGSSALEVNSPLSRVIDDQYAEVSATLGVARLAPRLPTPPPPVTTVSDLGSAPLTAFSTASVATGFVSVGFFQEGAVRSLPLAIEVKGHVYPQFGLVLACRMLDVDPATLRYTDRSVIIPRPGNPDIVIPTHPQRSNALDTGVQQVMDIPWFGTSNWGTMYDHPKHVTTAQHVPILQLWDVRQTRDKIARHVARLDEAMISIIAVAKSDAEAAKYADSRAPLEDIAARLPLAEELLPTAKDTLEFVLLSDPKDWTERDQKFVTSAKVFPTMVEQARLLQSQLRSQRAQLANLLGGKAVLIGWTATGAAADFVPTSLHAKCPGVVVHGAIFNAIMTQHFWRRAPGWVTIAITIFLGLATAFAASALTPFRAAIIAILLLGTYLVVNGIVLLDYFGVIVGVSPPMVAIAVVWGGCTLVRIIVEGKERAFITKRFSTYADPMLVDYLVEHPDQGKFDGLRKELTVVFTDLQGFTTISEKLGEKSVLLLNEYMGIMVPIIRRNRGYVNKFLGDGIMFFFGAPLEMKEHAAVALKTVLEMQDAMVPFNQRLATAELPPLIMRAGISTGEMIVGDAGSTDRSDYTVLGDAVNLGARLESGNKAIGTRLLASGRAKELGGEGLLLRPVGSYCYLGKSEGVATYEVVGRANEVTPAQVRLAELSKELVDAFAAAKFEACLPIIATIEAEFGPGKLTKLYHQLVEKHLSDGPPVGFCGNIVLSEK